MRNFPGSPGVPSPQLGLEPGSKRYVPLQNAYIALASVCVMMLLCITVLKGFCRCSRCEAARAMAYPGIAADNWNHFGSHSAKTVAYDTAQKHHHRTNQQFNAQTSFVHWPPLPHTAAAQAIPPAPAPELEPEAASGSEATAPSERAMSIDIEGPGGNSAGGSSEPHSPTSNQTPQQLRQSRLPGNDGAVKRPREAALPNLCGLDLTKAGHLNQFCVDTLANKMNTNMSMDAVKGTLRSYRNNGAVRIY